MMTANLSPHFTLEEMVRTVVRTPNRPGPVETENLRSLCAMILEPLRGLVVPVSPTAWIGVGAIHIDSGYRSPTVNSAVGGAKDSAHTDGRAADLVALNPTISCGILVQAIVKSDLPYDKVIFESPAGSSWVHVQIARAGIEPKRQALMCLSPGAYVPWDPKGRNGAVK